MQKVQLYIQDTRVDLFKDESVSITQTIQNVRDVAKILLSLLKLLLYLPQKQIIKYLNIITILI